MLRVPKVFSLLLLAGLIECDASTIDLGFISFDTLIPSAPGSPGVNDFSLDNFTGDPTSGGFALPPDFPVLTNATFLDATWTLFSDTTSLVFSLGDLGPGSYNPEALEFSDSQTFTSALFTASLSPGALFLQDGTSFVPATTTLQVELSPSEGPALQPGVDFSLISVPQTIPAPEPSTLALFAAAVLVCLGLRLRYGLMRRP